MNKEFLEALEEYAESCIRTGHTDVSECALWFARENNLDKAIIPTIECELLKIMDPDNIKLLRKYSKMTKKQFSEYFGIPYRTLQNWEDGSRSCPEYLKKLMHYKLIKESLIKEEKTMTRFAIKKGLYEIREREGVDIQSEALDNALEGRCDVISVFETHEEALEELSKYRTTHMIQRYNHISVIAGTCFFIEEETLNPDFDSETDSEWEEWESAGSFDPAEIE